MLYDKDTVKVRVFCTFEAEVDIPEDIRGNQEAIDNLIEEFIGSPEMLAQNVSDSGAEAIYYEGSWCKL